MITQRISVAVVHDHFLIRTGLANTFAACDDIALRTLVEGDAALVPDCDVVVADPESGMRVLSLVSTLPAGTRRPRVVIIAESEREWQIREALAQGAAAYLLLGMTGEELVSAVRGVYQGGCHLSPAISAKLVESLGVEPLTARQEDVLALLAGGLSNKHIAARLGITVGTVSSRTEAVAAARRRWMLRHAGLHDEATRPASSQGC
jgi:DNA-binding NarL/FixJ family response regulator